MNGKSSSRRWGRRTRPSGRCYLVEVCGGDLGLRQRIEALLESHALAGDFLNMPAAQQLAAATGTPNDHSSADSDDSGAEGPHPDPSLDFLAPTRRPDSLGRLGHYEVLEVIGQGGMGVVLRGFDEKLHRTVAIKVLASPLAVSGSARERFVREARAAAAVSHDNVIAIHAVEDDGPTPYLVMQFIDGPTLQEKIERAGPLPLKEIVRIGLQVADGLAAAHRQGLVHRDVKPANILLENGVERVKITDFGLARAVDDASLTQSGVIAGTPMFMSPEQANGEPVDHRSDLFSLGTVPPRDGHRQGDRRGGEHVQSISGDLAAQAAGTTTMELVSSASTALAGQAFTTLSTTARRGRLRRHTGRFDQQQLHDPLCRGDADSQPGPVDHHRRESEHRLRCRTGAADGPLRRPCQPRHPGQPGGSSTSQNEGHLGRSRRDLPRTGRRGQ